MLQNVFFTIGVVHDYYLRHFNTHSPKPLVNHTLRHPLVTLMELKKALDFCLVSLSPPPPSEISF